MSTFRLVDTVFADIPMVKIIEQTSSNEVINMQASDWIFINKEEAIDTLEKILSDLKAEEIS